MKAALSDTPRSCLHEGAFTTCPNRSSPVEPSPRGRHTPERQNMIPIPYVELENSRKVAATCRMNTTVGVFIVSRLFDPSRPFER